MKNFTIPILLVTLSSLLAYLVLEVGYRVWTYYTIKNKMVPAAMAQFPPTPGGTSSFDGSTGYRHRPNITVERRDGPFPIFWTTNSHGHIAQGDYPVAKPDGRETRLLLQSYELFRQKTADIQIIRMIDRLPKPRSREEIDSWYNVPHDQHNSDMGLRLYGEAVADLVIKRFAK